MTLRNWKASTAWLVLAAAAALSGVFLAQRLGGNAASREIVSAQAVAGLFALSFDDSRGRPQALAQWKGKVLVVNFWATWCPPCREEMPAFSRISEKYASKGVQFVGISTDPADAVAAFAAERRIAYPLLSAGPGALALSAGLGNRLYGLPHTVVLGRNGEPLLVRTGRLAESELEDVLKGVN